MGMKCPMCDTDNPSDSKHSKEYVTPLSSSEGIPHNHTLTLETLIDETSAGETLARKHPIIQEREKSGQDGLKIKYNETHRPHKIHLT